MVTLHFPSPLIPARLIRRYKRFLADCVLLDGPQAGQELTIHCPNPGAMTGLAAPNMRIWLAPAGGKLPYRWMLSETATGLVGIDTGLPNRLAEAAIAAGQIPALGGYQSLRREVRYGAASRIDLLLSDPVRGLCYVEVKNVHLVRRPGLAEFPDCVTARGAKHLGELAAMVAAGHRAVMLYIIQRGDCDRFALAGDIDPGYAAAFAAARAAGVEALCVDCAIGLDGITLGGHIALQD